MAREKQGWRCEDGGCFVRGERRRRVFDGGVSGGSGWEVCGGMGGEIVRDMEGDMETDGASRFWETVPKAGRFFCAIVEL